MEAFTHYRAVDGKFFNDKAKCVEHEQEFVKDIIGKLNLVKTCCEENFCDKCPFMTQISGFPENCLFRLSMSSIDDNGKFTFAFPDAWDFNW